MRSWSDCYEDPRHPGVFYTRTHFEDGTTIKKAINYLSLIPPQESMNSLTDRGSRHSSPPILYNNNYERIYDPDKALPSIEPAETCPLEAARLKVRNSTYTVTRKDLQYQIHWKHYILQNASAKARIKLRNIMELVAREISQDTFLEKGWASAMREELYVSMVDGHELVDELMDYVVLNAGLAYLHSPEGRFGRGDKWECLKVALEETIDRLGAELLVKGVDVEERQQPVGWSLNRLEADRKVSVICRSSRL